MFDYTFEDVVKQSQQTKWAIFPCNTQEAVVIRSSALRALIKGLENPQVRVNGSLEISGTNRLYKLAWKSHANDIEKYHEQNAAPKKKTVRMDSLRGKIAKAKQQLRYCYDLGNPYAAGRRAWSYQFRTGKRNLENRKRLGRLIAQRFGRKPTREEMQEIQHEILTGKLSWDYHYESKNAAWKPDVERYALARKEYLSYEARERRVELKNEIHTLETLFELELVKRARLGRKSKPLA